MPVHADKLELVFAHTPSYPDEAPLYKARRLIATHHNITHSEFPFGCFFT